MKLYKVLVALTTLMLIAITCCASMGMSFSAVMGLVLTAQVLLVWMVIEVLMVSARMDKKFDHYFYQDEDIRRDM